ncbi:MucR family transcriptional regulator [Sphingobium sp. RAC03]|uniref:MucR family transcriptional regulator n=1 Tax=Sphingobium sp. RAC03 TaxID=1843368 RepID=UPI00083E598C|nr:MucR family transcriptional regulator [Sphingobium sp. RAC03]AOF98408.1 ROS/MUCR transcriptional regulator family protein [Sphingobium sp. RAC03]
MTEVAVAQDALITLTADIVAAHVSNNSVAIGDLSQLISNVHSALAGLGTPSVPEVPRQEPAVSVRTSVKPDYIVCLEDGKKLKMLKRHLRTSYQMTPHEYRAKWNLPSDYPMTAPNYAQQRKELAQKIGLGRKPGIAVSVEPLAKEPVTRARKPKAKAEVEPA